MNLCKLRRRRQQRRRFAYLTTKKSQQAFNDKTLKQFIFAWFHKGQTLRFDRYIDDVSNENQTRDT